MNIDEIITIMSGLITLATAWFGYKAATKSKAGSSTNVKEHKIVQFTDPTINTRSWSIQKTKYLYVIPSIMWSLVIIIFSRNASISVFSVVLTLTMIILVALARDKPPSRTIKTAEFTIKDSREKILRKCLDSLEKCDVKVGEYDIEKGIIVGRTKMSWRSFGEIITIELGKSSPKGISLRVTSDIVEPQALTDFGINAINIQRIKTELLK